MRLEETKPLSNKWRHTSKGCKFNLTLNSFGSVKSQVLERFATASLYKRRGEVQVLEAVINSNQTAL